MRICALPASWRRAIGKSLRSIVPRGTSALSSGAFGSRQQSPATSACIIGYATAARGGLRDLLERDCCRSVACGERGCISVQPCQPADDCQRYDGHHRNLGLSTSLNFRAVCYPSNASTAQRAARRSLYLGARHGTDGHHCQDYVPHMDSATNFGRWLRNLDKPVRVCSRLRCSAYCHGGVCAPSPWTRTRLAGVRNV